MQDDKQILLVAQKNAAQDDPTADDIYDGRHDRDRSAAAEAARRHREGAGRGRRARAKITALHRQRGLLPGRGRRSSRTDADEERNVEALSRSVIAQFEQYIKLNKKIPPEVLVSVNQIDRAGKLADTIASHLALKDRRKAGTAGDSRRCLRAPGKVFSYMEGEDRRPAGREEDPQPRQAPDGEDPARVLSQRADEGDPEGAGRNRRRPRRAGRARREDQQDQAVQGSPRRRPWRS